MAQESSYQTEQGAAEDDRGALAFPDAATQVSGGRIASAWFEIMKDRFILKDARGNTSQGRLERVDRLSQRYHNACVPLDSVLTQPGGDSFELFSLTPKLALVELTAIGMLRWDEYVGAVGLVLLRLDWTVREAGEGMHRPS